MSSTEEEKKENKNNNEKDKETSNTNQNSNQNSNKNSNKNSNQNSYDNIINNITNIFNSLEKDGLEIKEVTYENSRKEFIKGKEFEKIITKNQTKYLELFKKDFPNEIFNKKNTEDFINQIYSIFNQNSMMFKAIREEGDRKKKIKRLLPYELLVIEHGCICAREHDNQERDHNKHYTIEEIKKFNKELYYIINRKKSHKWSYFYLGALVFLILMYVLMPVWPYKVKVGVWWISYILLLLTAFIYGLRFSVYIFFFIFGYNVWILPDLDDPKLGVIDSFRRVISIEKRNEKWYTILIRVCISVFTGYVVYCFYRRPELFNDIKKLVYDALKDLYFYGEDKIVNSWNSTAVKVKHKTRTIEEIDDII
jgi:hypothetical protein